MGGPPDDPRLKSIWSELAQAGYDPDDVLESASRNAVKGGLHADHLPDLFDAVCSSVEDWEHVWLYAGPVNRQYDHHYELAHFVVEWSEEHTEWIPETGNTAWFKQYDNRFSDDLLTVSREESMKTEESPLARTVTGVPREEAIEYVSGFVEHAAKSTLEVQFRLRPDDVGENYEFSFEFLRRKEAASKWESVADSE